MNKFFKYTLILTLFLPCFAWANLQAELQKPMSVATTNLLFVSGQRTGLMNVPDKNGKAIREALDNIRAIAEKNGATMDDVVHLTFYFADPENDYPFLRGIVGEYFSDPANIARSVVGVSRIPDNDGVNFSINRRVEIDAVIAIKKKRLPRI